MGLNLGFIGRKLDQIIPGNQSFLHPNDAQKPRPTTIINSINQATGGSPVQRAQAAISSNNSHYVNPLIAIPKAAVNVPIQMVKNTAELAVNSVAAPIEQGISVFTKDPAAAAAIQADAARRSPVAQAGRPLSQALAGQDVGHNLLKSVGSTLNTVTTALPLVGFGKRQVADSVGKAVVRSAAQNAAYGGVAGASNAAANTGDVKATLEGGGVGAAAGAALGAAGEVLGQGAVKALKGVQKRVVTSPGIKEALATQPYTDPRTGKVTQVSSPQGVSNLAGSFTGGGESKTAKGVAKVVQKATPKEIVPNPPEITPVAPTKQDSLTNQLGEALTTRNKVIYKELKNIENQTGQTGLQDKFAYQAGLQARSNSIAAGKLESSPHFQQAVGGLGRKQLNEFNTYAAARRELANAAEGLQTSQPVDKLQKTVQSLDQTYAPRFAHLNNYYKSLATDLHSAGIIDDAQHQNFLADPNYVRVQRNMDELVNQHTVGGKSFSLGTTSASQKRVGSRRAVQPILETAAQHTQQVQNEIQRNETAKFLTGTLEKAGQAKKLVDSEDVAFRREMYKFLAKTKQAPIKKVSEFADANVRNNLESVANNLGVDVKRVLGNRGNWVGRSFNGQKRIELKAGAPERVMLHEIGHQLDEKFGIQDAVLGSGRSLPEKTLVSQIKKATEAGDTKLAANLEKQRLLNVESRKLAALRHEGRNPTKSFVQYTRKSEEKVAVMFEAYIHAPQRFKSVAPNLYKEFTSFLKAHEETASLTTVKPSLVIEKRVVQNRPDNPELDQARKDAYRAALARADKATRNKNTLSVYKNGIKETYEVSPEIKRVAEQINPFQLNVLQRIIAAPGRLFRAGTTGLRAPFTVANYLKDQQGSAVYSKNIMATHNPVSILSGLKDATKAQFGHVNDPLWDKFIAHAGDQTSYDLTRNIRSSTEQVQKIAGVKGGGLTRSVLHPVRTLEDLNSITEKATRFQNFKGIYRDALKHGATEGDALQEATIAAWRNSVDFQEAGSWGRAINLVIPYFNPAIQGSRQLQRSFRTRPVATSIKTLTSIGIPLAAATLWNTADEQRKKVYDNISDFEKQNSIVLVPPGTKQNQDGSYNVIKIPLEPGLGSLIQPIRRGIESAVNQTGTDVKGIAGDLFKSVSGPINPGSPEQMLGSLIPQAIKPGVQQIANKDFFTGKTIVPDYLNKGVDDSGNPLAEADKKYKFTSGTAGLIGGALGVSPIRVQKFLSDTFGKVGEYALNGSDHLLASKGTITPDQIGGTSVGQDFIRRFGNASGKYNYNKSDAAKYFEDLSRIADGVKDPKDKALFTAIHAKNPSPGIFDSAEKAAVYMNHPDLIAADAALNEAGVKRGQPSNPFFDLNPAQQQAVLLLRVGKYLPGQTYDKAGGSLFNDTGAGGFYDQYKKDEAAYYDAVEADQEKKAAATGKPVKPIDRPTLVDAKAPTFDQNKLNAYEALPKGTGARSGFLKDNPDLVQYFKDSAAFTNSQRAAVGLAPVDTSSSSNGGRSKFAYSSGGSRSGSSSEIKYSAKLARTPFKKAAKPKVAIKKGTKARATRITLKSGKAKVSLKKSLV